MLTSASPALLYISLQLEHILKLLSALSSKSNSKDCEVKRDVCYRPLLYSVPAPHKSLSKLLSFTPQLLNSDALTSICLSVESATCTAIEQKILSNLQVCGRKCGCCRDAIACPCPDEAYFEEWPSCDIHSALNIHEEKLCFKTN